MAKRKEIKFKLNYPVYEGRQDGVIYWIFTDTTANGTTGPRCTVSTQDTKDKGRTIRTAGHRYFHLDDAKEFCQQIAAGEIDLEALRAEFAAEDAAKEAAAVQGAVERAKKFRDKLEAVGISYHDLLELEVMAHSLGDIGHNILLGYERGEGWPNGN
jgi:hypothetical protein